MSDVARYPIRLGGDGGRFDPSTDLTADEHTTALWRFHGEASADAVPDASGHGRALTLHR